MEFPLSKEEMLMAAAIEATGDDSISDVAEGHRSSNRGRRRRRITRWWRCDG
jgi:hypothetical protein